MLVDSRQAQTVLEGRRHSLLSHQGTATPAPCWAPTALSEPRGAGGRGPPLCLRQGHRAMTVSEVTSGAAWHLRDAAVRGRTVVCDPCGNGDELHVCRPLRRVCPALAPRAWGASVELGGASQAEGLR